MKRESYQSELLETGFAQAGPDVWGKVLGEATVFVEINSGHALAWVWLPDANQYLGPRIRIEGPPERSVSEALFQLQGILQEEEATGTVFRGEEAAEEQVRA